MRLLLVDDDAQVREAMAQPLKDAGHEVESVADGATALIAVESGPFDLVLVDYQMPRMNGAEFIARARAIRPALKFLMVTGFADSAQLAAAAPDTPILSKPFSGAELIGKVDAMVGA